MADRDWLLKKLWLNCVCGHEPELVDKHIRALGSAEAVYDADASQLRRCRLGRAALDKSMSKAERVLRECEEEGIHIITIDDEKYPFRLRHTDCPPRILYVKGSLPDLDNVLAVCMVGSRKPSPDGLDVSYSVARELASRGAVIVSGMAVGTDRAAHVGALNAGNKTVAVLAGGVDVVYPKENADLYAAVIKNGAVISERPPHHPAESRLYRQRNRIIVGLCAAVVIAEGTFKSGTSMSARLALENNRDVFAVPITPLHRNAELPNSLLRDGAQIVRGAGDILDEYAYTFPQLLSNGEKLIGEPVRIAVRGGERAEAPVRPRREMRVEPERIEHTSAEAVIKKLSDSEQIEIVKYLCEHGSVHIDDIAEGCKISAGSLNSKLLILEMKGIVKRGAGNIYSPVLK